MYFFILAAGAFLAGLMINSVLRQSMNELLRESEEIDHTGFAFFKQMKLKYENYMRTGREINNTEAFAGRYLDKYRCHGIRIHSYEKASMCAAGLCVIFGACGALLDKIHALEYLLVGFLAMYVVTGSRHLIDVAGKRRRITTDLVDFFENRFSAATAETVREAAPIRKADIPVRKGPDDMGERVKFHENTQVTFTEEEKKLIDEILKEYLG